MNALARKSHWLAGAAGLALLAGGALSADESLWKAGSYRPTGTVTLVYSVSPAPNGLSSAVNDLGRFYRAELFWSVQPPPPDSPPPPYGPYPNPDRPGDGRIVGYEPDGRKFYEAYVGGPIIDIIPALAVDDSAVYVARESFNTDISYIHAEKLDGNAVGPLLYSTYVLGGGWATVKDIAVDPAGNAYLTGRTGNRSYDDSTNPYFEAAYIAKLDGSGNILYLRELDGQGYDEGLQIAADAAGNAYVVGTTSTTDFPIVGDPSGAPCNTQPYVARQFVAKLDPAGEVVYSRCYAGGKILEISPAPDGSLRLARAAADSPQGAEAVESFVLLNAAGFFADIIYMGETGVAPLAGFAFGPGGYFYVIGASAPGEPVCPGSVLARLNSGAGVSTSLCLPGARLYSLVVTPGGDAFVSGRVEAPGYFSAGQVGTSFLARFAFTANHPPDCSAATASPASIWPPDGRLVPVFVHGVTDPDGDPVTVTFTSLRQDEPPRGRAEAFGAGTPNASVRASRDGSGDGRTYHLGFQAGDGQGGLCEGQVTVCVPHDQRRARHCGDGGALFDSTGR